MKCGPVGNDGDNGDPHEMKRKMNGKKLTGGNNLREKIHWGIFKSESCQMVRDNKQTP